MGLPVEVNNLMLGSLGGYTVGRSLRFRSSASGYLSRTPTSTGNRKTWTYSTWMKLGVLGTGQGIFAAVQGTGVGNLTTSIIYQADGTISISGNTRSTTGFISAATTAVYRDPSAWYHIVVAFDTTQATLANGVKVYINGVQQTISGSYTQNWDTAVNMTGYVNWIAHVDNGGTASYYGDHYQAEVNFIDGQQLTPSSFGAYDTNGVWQPKKYTGTYGTNGFYLPFSNTTSTTTLVQDSSGNGNNWTPNNISLTAGTTYDSMIDSPTNAAGSSTGIGNYATWNPISPFGNQTFSNGNLSVATGTTGGAIATISVSSGRWYWEVNPTTIAAGTPRVAGLIQTITAPTSLTSKSIYLQNDGKYSINGAAAVTYGGAITTSDIVGIAVDVDAQTVTFYKNGTAMGSAISISSVYTSGDLIVPAIVQSGAANNAQDINCGQRPFAYTPPSGFKALNTYNLPAPSIANGAQYMAATTYTGTGSNLTISNTVNGVGFQPDFVWTKSRSLVAGHVLIDSVRGASKYLISNATNAEVTDVAGAIQSFNSTGYVIGTGTGVNSSGATHIGWQWKGGGTGVTNTAGTITSTVSANPSAGFSVVTYTGNGSSSATVGHGLNSVPSMIICKGRSYIEDWWTFHQGLGSGNTIQLNTTAASNIISSGTGAGSIATNPTSSVFGFTAGSGATVNNVNQNGDTYVAYCFSAVRGYSAFGSYTGNGSADGTFVYLGFRPRWILIKRDGVFNWQLFDTTLNPYNLSTQSLNPNTNAAENTGTTLVFDILSNGFKLKSVDGNLNASGGLYIYAAFAEHPFNYSRAR